MYTFHITFGDQPAVLDYAARAQARLAGLPGLDLVPPRWLHLTTQGIGFTDEVNTADIAAIAAAARDRLQVIPPVRVTVGPARTAIEGIACDVTPPGALAPVRDGLREAMASVWPPERVPESQAWHPHVSLAYANRPADASAYAAALAGSQETVTITVRAAELIVLGRDHHVYEWDVHSTLQLSPEATGLDPAP